MNNSNKCKSVPPVCVFKNSEFGDLEIVQDGDKFWFPATKCAIILGYQNATRAIRTHCKGGTEMVSPSPGGPQKMKFISEGDLYRLIVRSKLESAQRFEEWVFDEVLPTVRRHGLYATPEVIKNFMEDPKRLGDVFYALAAEQEKVKLLTEENRKLTPKAAYCDLILQNPKAVPIPLIAKDYGLSAQKLNAMLAHYHIQYPMRNTWALYQEYADFGYTHTNVFYTRGGEMHVHTCWTQAGRLFLYNFLKSKGYLPIIEKEVG